MSNATPRSWAALGGIALCAGLLASPRASADSPASADDLGHYKKLTLEQLMDVEVTSVSRRPEKLRSTASAIQVITRDDIRRSGATSIPEALRLASNLQVAQVNANQWAISARGFNNVLANKLLVLIDGRSVYTPVFSGVFWDVQDTLLEDVERIEVISGPGGALWGANAVNGVINVVTRRADETQGSLVQAAAGTELPASVALRQGGRLGQLTYRAYGKGFQRDGTVLDAATKTQDAGSRAHDSWSMGQGGLRLDWDPGTADRLTFQGDLYRGRPRSLRGDMRIGHEHVAGGNGLARWTRELGEGSDLQLQLYYDRAQRKDTGGRVQRAVTYDLDGQHRFQLGERHEIVWGGGYRLVNDLAEDAPTVFFLPERERRALYSGFVQDQIALVPHQLELTLGSKIEHHAYTGYEVQPSARLAWSPSTLQTVWGSVSRARRTPSRLEHGFRLTLAPPLPPIVVFQGKQDFESEDLLAWELGWRAQPSDRFSFSAASFYNRYDRLRSADPGTVFPPFPITFENGARGRTYGVELSATFQAAPWWRLRGGYTAEVKHLVIRSGHVDLNRGEEEYRDPAYQWLIQSSLDLPRGFELNTVLRYVDSLPDQQHETRTDPHVPSYFGLDVSLVWKLGDRLELALVGQNLLERRHLEFVSADPPHRELERGVLARITWRH